MDIKFSIQYQGYNITKTLCHYSLYDCIGLCMITNIEDMQSGTNICSIKISLIIKVVCS